MRYLILSILFACSTQDKVKCNYEVQDYVRVIANQFALKEECDPDVVLAVFTESLNKMSSCGVDNYSHEADRCHVVLDLARSLEGVNPARMTCTLFDSVENILLTTMGCR